MNRFWKNYKLEVIVFCLIFGIRFAYTLFVQIKFGAQAFSAFSDADAYLLLANNLLERHSFSVMQAAPWISDSLRTPLYPFVIAGFYLAKSSIIGFIILQNILAGFVGVLLVRLGQLFFKSGTIGFIAALIYAFEPASIYWNGLVMPDNGFAFLVVLSLYLFAKKQWLWFSFILGLSVLARPVALYFFPLFLLLYVYIAIKSNNRNLIMHLKKAALMVFVLLAVICPWIIRNKIVFDTYELSSAGWYNSQFPISRFARENNIQYSEPQMPSDFFPSGADIENVPRAEYIFAYDFSNVPFYKGQFFRIVKESPIGYAIYHFKSMIRSLVGHDYEYMFEYVVQDKFRFIDARIGELFITLGNSLWMVLYAFIIFGLFFKEFRSWKVFLFVFIIWNSFLVAMAGGSWGGRYNLPVAPIMFLLASYGMYAWYNMINKLYVRDKRI